MQFKTYLAVSAATASLACGLATPAFAQSTGSQEFDKEIVVTGARTGTQNVAGIAAPDTAKAKAVLTQENLARQNPGQTVLDSINQIPGVSFQNNDAYGSAGGTLNIRGFSADRVSLTFDGVPLNDSGNYAIYSNQQIDPELIDQVNVNLGTTDVDSPTASAAGGTVNLRTKKPDRDFGAMLSGSMGEWDFMRLFGKIETGDLNASGTRAFFSASMARNRIPFNNYGKIDKQQYNAKIYQPLGGDDFVSVSAHYNQNRNNFFGSVPLRLDTNGGNRIVGPNNSSAATNRFPLTRAERFYNINFPCQMDTPQSGVADTPAAAPNNQSLSCGTEFDRRYNPSNTGNIRGQLRLTLADKLVFNFEPSYQYVKANGGGTVTGSEGLRDINPADPDGSGPLAAIAPTFGALATNSCQAVPNSAFNTCRPGYLGGTPYFGRDLNGDGDTLDTVTVMAPSQTQTHRLGAIAGLRYEINESHTLRLNYTWDRARHRQTGEVGLVLANGQPVDVFPVNAGERSVLGSILQKRDRLSYASLHQISGEYRGEFMDNRLVLTAGLRMPFFKRDLTNNCYTSSASGFVECFSGDPTNNALASTLNPYVVTTNATTGAITVSGWATPQNRVYNYKKLLPNVGFVFDLTSNASVFGNFSQGLSVPGTDNLYNAFYFPLGTSRAQPKPETTDNFDLGLRFRSGTIQAQVSGFYNQFHNRSASAYDPEINQTVYRNLGNVKKYGVDGSIAFQPVPQLTLYAFGSVMKSEIKDNIAIGENRDGTPIYALTAGKRESGAPKYSFGGTIRAELGPIEIGFTAKRTGERFVYDNNEAVYTGTFIPNGAQACTNVPTPVCTNPVAVVSRTQVYDAKLPAYWLANLDVRFKLDMIKLGDSYFQVNVYNLFDTLYVGGYGGNLLQNTTGSYNQTTGTWTYGSVPNVQIGAPRTVSATLVIKY
ncbi:TonB-dependent receptor [Novosphingobium sp.]|uniref:TonB-dependent receptor n=1 Tax=Novosphingobium sp. TaxID=1874826 RepID=UPI0025E4B32F|nr:TonB-dependent receptor [Novosphingobium sp.]MCC6927338.1 TonB-dependent receptor [Novosphingobium sp.]